MSGQYGPDAAGEGGSEVTGDNVEIGEGACLAMGLSSLIHLIHHTIHSAK